MASALPLDCNPWGATVFLTPPPFPLTPTHPPKKNKVSITGLISCLQIQPPSPRSPTPPLFLPSDPPLAWLLAKTWVRNSDFQLHQLQYHLLNTHLVAEVIAVATMRHLPGLHPVFKVRAMLYPLYPSSDPRNRKQPESQRQGDHKNVCQFVRARGETSWKTAYPPNPLSVASFRVP